VVSTFTPSHRGGSGPPLVLLHGFLDTWRVWELVLPALERHHDVLALTLAGHAGGPPIDGEVRADALAGPVERAMDEAGFESAHIAGNSLGGFVALQLAARGRARTVTALAPAGGWAPGDESYRDLLRLQAAMRVVARSTGPHAEALVASEAGRRRATALISVNFEHIPAELLVHQLMGVAGCTAARALTDHALREGWQLDAERIDCPVRVVWGTADRLLPWPSAAARFREDWLAHADWVVLDGVGHCPQLDVPVEAAELIRGFAAG
jgi:pimeloyl-ACP methyl ester carboxylesterase